MLTKKQHELLQFISIKLEESGVSPSFDEMRDALNLRSKSGIHRLITALEERGFIRRLPHRARALEVIKMPDSTEKQPTKLRLVKNHSAPVSPRPYNARPIEVANAIEIPVMGRIAAGVPIDAISEVSHNVAVPGSMLSGRGNHYALEVKGDSMIEAGINDGDIVVIREQNTADNGDIVVALVEGYEATLKRLKLKNGMIALEAANPAYDTRILPKDQVQIQGKLVGLIRSY